MLDTLPDDVLYLVLFHLDTARDVLALILTSQRLRTLIQNGDGDGWRIFVLSRFPDVSVPSLSSSASSSSSYSWHDLASSLTWQTRAWDRRSLSFQALMPSPPSPQGRRHQGRRRQEAPFHPVLDAYLDFSTREELVIWGAGENLVARRRQLRSAGVAPGETVWHRLDGKDLGYRSGVDDIKAVSLVEDACGRTGSLGVLVGRDNGNLSLLSAGESDFGERLAAFSPQEDSNQGTINSVDVLRQKGLVAAAAKSGAFLYSLPDSSGADVAPNAFLDLPSQGLDPSATSLGNAKWMGENLIALGLSGHQSALRYVTVNQAGFGDIETVKKPTLEENFHINYDKSRLCTSSLTPIDASSIVGGGGSNLLLSAWRDGTVRLQDLRTPSPLDLVYCDNIDPWSEFEALLPFGTSHFAGGGAHGATIKVFDFRWPRQYYHTTALPCADAAPLPRPSQPFLAAPAAPDSSAGRPCDHVVGRLCRWHALSRELYYRPNGKFFFSKSLPREHAHAGVWSMARASLVSPSFYIGISGGVVEADVAAGADARREEGEPHLDWGHRPKVVSSSLSPSAAMPPPPRDTGMAGAGYTSYDLDASLMETGDGVLSVYNDRNVRMPPMRGKGWSRITEKIGHGAPEGLARRHRLDARYHMLDDFEQSDTWWDGISIKEGSWFDDHDDGEV